MTEIERRNAGLLYNVYETGDPSWHEARQLLPKINACGLPEEARPMLESLLGRYPKSSSITLPFYCDLGHGIELGEHVGINMDCLFLDEARIILKDRVKIGPRCSFYTPIHPMDPEIRATGLEKAAPITIEEDVWLCGSVTVNGGVTIGKGSVIGSGSVVVHDIEPGVFAAGNPCRVIRKIGEADRALCQAEYDAYRKAMGR